MIWHSCDFTEIATQSGLLAFKLTSVLRSSSKRHKIRASL